MKRFILSLSVLLTSQFFISCQESETVAPAKEEISSEVIATVKQFTTQYGSIQNVIKLIQDALGKYAPNGRMAGEAEVQGDLPTCAKVTPDLKNKTLKVDFGSGCQLKNGANVSGSLTISYTGKFGQSGSVITAVMANLGVGGNTINGKIEMKDFVKNSTGSQLEYRIVLSDLKMALSDGTSTAINLDLKQNWEAGFNTTDDADNQIKTSFTGNFTDTKSKYYTVNTPTAIFTKGDCEPLSYPMPVSGLLEMTPKDSAKIAVDFGGGNCDTMVKITVGGVTKEINVADK